MLKFDSRSAQSTLPPPNTDSPARQRARSISSKVDAQTTTVTPRQPSSSSPSTTTQTKSGTGPMPPATRTQATWERVLLMPELAYALQCFLNQPHLAVASRVCHTWHQVWTPFLWKHLSLPRSRPLTPFSSSRFSSKASTATMALSQRRHSRRMSINDNSDREEYGYTLSPACLASFGKLVMRLDATWLTTPELLRIASYCHQLRALKLSDCPLPTKALSTLLQSLRRLSRLSLDIPLRDYSADAEEGDDDEGDGGAAAAEYREEDERTRGRIFHRDELGENGIMKAVEMYASSETLEYLELTFQSSIRISVKAICLLLKCQRSLRTLKLVDADIEDPQSSRRSTKIKKKKAKDDYRKKEGRHSNRSNSANGEASSTAVASPGTAKSGPGSSAMSSAALSAASPTASSTASSGISGSLSGVGSPSPSTSPTPSISDNDDSGDGGTELPPTEWKETDSSFGLHFLSISSSHTSDSSLAHILEHCPQLRALHLHSCDTITDQSLQAMVQHCPQLESISLSSCKGLTTQGLDQFFREKGQAASAGSPLVHVHLCDLAALHDETLEILAACHGRSLLKLAIYFCGFVTDKGVIALLTTCSRLRVFGLQAYGMTPAIFEQPWASSRTIEQLDLQGVFKKVYLDPSGAAGAATANNFSATAMWQDRQARIDGFAITKARVITLDRLKNLRLAAGGIGKEVLGGFAPSQRIEVLHLYGLQSTQVDTLPWTAIKTCYPYLKQVYCGVVGVIRKSIRDELVRLNVELLASSSIPDLAFENNFDD